MDNKMNLGWIGLVPLNLLTAAYGIAGGSRMVAGTVAIVADSAALSGVLADSLGRPITRAQVYTSDSTMRVTTDAVGHFAFRNLPPGMNHFAARAIGYAPVEFSVDLNPGETRYITVKLREVATRLTAIIVNETRTHQILRELGFYERMGNIRGTFLTPEILAAHGASRASDYLHGVNSVRLQQTGQTGAIPYSTGGYMKIGSQGLCIMNLYIDGTRVDLGTLSDRVGGPRGLEEVPVTFDDVIAANDVGAIEVYPSGVTTPQQYTAVSRGCGTILVWTRNKLEFNPRDTTSQM